jgi:hypothetical protein
MALRGIVGAWVVHFWEVLQWCAEEEEAKRKAAKESSQTCLCSQMGQRRLTQR